jgi:hypothetical protein
MTRRQALKTTTLAAAVCATATALRSGWAQSSAGTALAGGMTGPFTFLPPLPYAFDALEPHMDTLTMQIHHDKHHAASVANLNKAVSEFPEVGNQQVEELLINLNAVPRRSGPQCAIRAVGITTQEVICESSGWNLWYFFKDLTKDKHMLLLVS